MEWLVSPDREDLAVIGLSLGGGLLVGYGVALLSGFFPLSRALAALPSPFGRALVLFAAAGLAALGCFSIAVIFLGPAWAPALITAGLALLAGPLVFQALPLKLANGAIGLCTLLAAEAALLTAMAGYLTA